MLFDRPHGTTAAAASPPMRLAKPLVFRLCRPLNPVGYLLHITDKLRNRPSEPPNTSKRHLNAVAKTILTFDQAW
jgi:hypothetical protein